MTTIHDVVRYHMTEAKRCREHIERNGDRCPRAAYEEIATFHDECAAVLHDHLAKGAQEWQPIETAPRDGTEIFLWQSDHTVPVVAHWYWFGDRELMQGCWVANKSFYSAEHSVVEDDTDTKYVTHWMPLPAAPMLSQRGEVES